MSPRKPRLWPDIHELEARRSECLAQINSRRAILEGRWLQRGGGDGLLPFSKFADADVVLANLRLRLSTYDVDIARMAEHELTAIDTQSERRGRVWACKCRATGTAPTIYTAMVRYNEHVEQAVWGVEP